MTRLLCGKETVTICYAVSIEYRNVTDRQNCYINIARQYADARQKHGVRAINHTYKTTQIIFIKTLDIRVAALTNPWNYKCL